MWKECSCVLYSDIAKQNQNDVFVEQIGKIEKKHAHQNLELTNSSNQPT